MKLKALSLSVIALASACSITDSRPERNDLWVDMIIPKSAAHIELQSRQRFFAPVPINAPLPDFQAGYLSTGKRVVICSELVISEDGAVTSDEQIDDGLECEEVASEDSQHLYPLVHRAVHQWQYFGAAICDFELNEGECDDPGARLSPVAVKLAYKFTFSTTHDHPSVSRDDIQGR
jgi:hypothetical protein